MPWGFQTSANPTIYPEERSHRLDSCWGREEPGEWVSVPTRFAEDILEERGQGKIWITSAPSVSSECPDYDLVYWRRWYLFLAPSHIHGLLEALGMNERFARWLSVLIRRGEIPLDDRAVLREHLVAAKGAEGEAMIPRLVLPFGRRFGDLARAGGRASHFFADM